MEAQPDACRCRPVGPGSEASLQEQLSSAAWPAGYAGPPKRAEITGDFFHAEMDIKVIQQTQTHDGRQRCACDCAKYRFDQFHWIAEGKRQPAALDVGGNRRAY